MSPVWPGLGWRGEGSWLLRAQVGSQAPGPGCGVGSRGGDGMVVRPEGWSAWPRPGPSGACWSAGGFVMTLPLYKPV